MWFYWFVLCEYEYVISFCITFWTSNVATEYNKQQQKSAYIKQILLISLSLHTFFSAVVVVVFFSTDKCLQQQYPLTHQNTNIDKLLLFYCIISDSEPGEWTSFVYYSYDVRIDWCCCWLLLLLLFSHCSSVYKQDFFAYILVSCRLSYRLTHLTQRHDTSCSILL